MQLLSQFKNVALFFVLAGFVLFVNYPIIQADLLYPEQPIIYLANQQITSIFDLINIYLHPKLFHFDVPFFRPSGHFLMYQLLTPIFGWHNTRALLVVNFIFLALTGFMMIKFYQLLFLRFKIGGYIAFAFYLMHPALSLSRLVILHFEFAYVFFLMLGLYCFALFCKRNITLDSVTQRIPTQIKFQHFAFLAWALLFYAVAITFKESAVILGPILAAYFGIALYDKQSLPMISKEMLRNKQVWQIVMLIVITTLTLALYLAISWPILAHPFRHDLNILECFTAMNTFIKMIFSLDYHFASSPALDITYFKLRSIVFPPITRFIIWAMSIVALISVVLLWMTPSKEAFQDKKSLVFLAIASLASLILPIGWGMGMPWHLSLTLLFLSLIMGFGVEYLCQSMKNDNRRYFMGGAVAGIIGLSTVTVDLANVKRYVNNPQLLFKLAVARNAVFNPPTFQKKLNSDSVLVVADSIVKEDYYFGATSYPYSFIGEGVVDLADQLQQWNFIKLETNYNGTLFRWAYLNASLHEELYPFQVDKMDKVPNDVIYNWLQHYDNIFSVGYDTKAHWHDQTTVFKQNLLNEQKKRHLAVNTYDSLVAKALRGKPIEMEDLPYADAQLCQYRCDQNNNCSGFTYITAGNAERRVKKCVYFSSVASDGHKLCPVCTGFIKITKENSMHFYVPGQSITKMSLNLKLKVKIPTYLVFSNTIFR